MRNHYSHLLLILNPVLYLGMLVTNYLAVTLPINGKSTGELSDLYPNLFVPDGLTFSIWGVIYLLLLLFIFTPLVKRIQNKYTTDPPVKTQVLTAVSCLLNISWIICWHYEYVFASILIMLCLLFTLITLYGAIQNTQTDLCVHSLTTKLPVSVYLGWITVATIANVTAGLVHWQWNGLSLPEHIWTVIMICIAALLTVIMVLKHNDWAFALVIIWALWGIIRKRTTTSPLFPEIVNTAIVAIIGILIITGIRLFRSLRKAKS